MLKQEGFLNKYGLSIYIITLLIVRYLMVTPLPIYAIIAAMEDDSLMVCLAKNLFDGNYLGNYMRNTFVKGIGFPLFLSFSKVMDVSYITMSLMFYAIACIIFIYSVKPVFSKGKLAFLYTLLLFNPAALCLQNLQRVYRNNIVLSQVLIIFASMIALYLRRNEKINIKFKWALLGGINLWWMMNTREESFWILPFVVTATAVNIVLLFKEIKKNKKFRNLSLFISVIPLIILLMGNQIQCIINYNVYGQYLVNEISGGNFPKAMKSIYSVKPVEYELKYGNRISVPYSTFEKIYEVSPTFNSMRNSFDSNYKVWDRNDSHPNDGQVENGWLFWCLRMTVFKCSDGTAQDCERIYEAISNEINQAADKGIIQRRNTMPSALMAPWRKGYGAQYLKILPRAVKSVVTFEGTEAAMQEAVLGNSVGIELYQFMTKNDLIYPGVDTMADKEDLQSSVDMINVLHKIYSKANPILFIISIICVLILLVKCFIFKKIKETGNSVLFISAVFLSMVVLICGVSYNHLSSCDSINSLYLASAFELLIIIEGISIISVIRLPKKSKSA